MYKLRHILKRDNSQVLIGNLIASLFGLFNFMLMVRMMRISDFGQFVIFVSAAGLVDLIRTGFVRQGLVRHWIINKQQSKKNLIGSAWLLHLAIALSIILLCQVAAIIPQLNQNGGIKLFFTYYPLLLLANIPHQMTSWIAQAKKMYFNMNMFRIAVNALFFFVLIINYKKIVPTENMITYLVICHITISLLTLIFFNSIKDIIHAKRQYLLSLFHFGKFSLSTLAGSNLLKSTDTILIGLILNTESAAIYAIPFKVIELIEIPLRGFVMTSFNDLTKHFQRGNVLEFNLHFKQNVFFLTLAVLPISTLTFFFPSIFIHFLGGAKYSDGIYVLQILSLAMLIIPLDKYVGVALDSINQPNKNAIKVWLMVLINAIGDFTVIALDGSLWMIAAVTVVNIALGACYGIVWNPFLRISTQMRQA